MHWEKVSWGVVWGHEVEEHARFSFAGADDFLPVMIYVTIHANPQQLASNLEYIQRFRMRSKMVSESSYFYTQLVRLHLHAIQSCLCLYLHSRSYVIMCKRLPHSEDSLNSKRRINFHEHLKLVGLWLYNRLCMKWRLPLLKRKGRTSSRITCHCFINQSYQKGWCVCLLILAYIQFSDIHVIDILERFLPVLQKLWRTNSLSIWFSEAVLIASSKEYLSAIVGSYLKLKMLFVLVSY